MEDQGRVGWKGSTFAGLVDVHLAGQFYETETRRCSQDFTGVPAVVDLAAMRDAITRLGGDPDRINPLVCAALTLASYLCV